MESQVVKLIYETVLRAESLYIDKGTGKVKKEFVKSFFPDIDNEIFDVLLEGVLSLPIVQKELKKIHSKCGCFS